MGMTLRDIALLDAWENGETIPCSTDNRFAYTEQIGARQMHVREGLAYRCVSDCAIYVMCKEYTDALPEKPHGVIQAGRYYR